MKRPTLNMKKTQILILIAASIVLTVACEHDKTNLPTIPPGEEQFTSLDDAEYVQLNPVLDASLGSEYDFIRPADVYVGVDNFIYVANTGKNEIVMMDGGGQIQGRSQFISQPEAITQNDSL
ncbi:MAG: hypothetical protein GWN16_05530, partial [Calditrichae bacterium]|nr:hypothetical protein [Calditrichia bacterium]